jgi:hypothetical protein
VAGFAGGQAADIVIARHAIGVEMNATLDRMAVQAAVNPAALHILSRNLDVLGELRALDTTRAFGAQIEAYVALEGEQIDRVLEQIRNRVVEMWSAGRPTMIQAA